MAKNNHSKTTIGWLHNLLESKLVSCQGIGQLQPQQAPKVTTVKETHIMTHRTR
jgi:hypothetical protein